MNGDAICNADSTWGDNMNTAETVALGIYVAAFVVGAVAEIAVRSRPDAHEDRRLLINFGLGALGSLIATLPLISTMGAAELAARQGIGILSTFSVPLPLGILIVVATISFQSYWTHRLMHRVGWLWRFHRVHHSDLAVDISTGFRGHPVEYAFDAIVRSACIMLIGPSAEAFVWGMLSLQIPTLLVHANIRMPAGLVRPLSILLATPPIHLRHHSSMQTEHDSNYGNAIILWDRLFGTFSGELPRAPLGLDTPEAVPSR